MENSHYKYNDNGRVIIPDQDIISKLPSDGGDHWNRLIFEKSPYLLQHAANPVDLGFDFPCLLIASFFSFFITSRSFSKSNIFLGTLIFVI